MTSTIAAIARPTTKSWWTALGAVLLLATTGALADAAGSGGRSEPAQVSEGAGRAGPPRWFTVVATGDTLIQYRVRQVAAAAGARSGVRYDFGPMFAPIAPVIAAADLAICNMETPISRPGGAVGAVGQSPYGGSLLVAPYEVAAGLRSVGFDRCSTATNHSYDLGASGIATTIEALAAHGITATGTARTYAESIDTVFDVNGVTVAHLSFTTDSNTYLPSELWRVNRTRDPLLIAGRVDAARQAGAEVVLVSLHLLKEQLAGPIGYDRDLVTRMTAAADIDAVIMHGPHVVQPFEWVNGSAVWWSLGNFVSDMGPPSTGRYSSPYTSDGLVAHIGFRETSPGEFEARPMSIALCNDFADRTVRASVLGLARTDISTRVRNELTDCLARTRTRVPAAI